MTIIDQTGNPVVLSAPARRIVSLVPSQTELLHALGLKEEVIGITKFCVHPKEWFNTKQRIGGTKQAKTALILSLQPDLVIANKEENVEEQVTSLRSNVPVYTSQIATLADAYCMIEDVATLTGKYKKGMQLVEKIKDRFSTLSCEKKYRTLYLIWRNPFMAAGGDTFIHNMMQHAGMENVLKETNRYPSLTPSDIISLNPECVLLSSEPYPFKNRHIDELQQLLPQAKILLVNGEMFSWYGSRLLKVPTYFKQLRKKPL